MAIEYTSSEVLSVDITHGVRSDGFTWVTSFESVSNVRPLYAERHLLHGTDVHISVSTDECPSTRIWM